MGHLQYIFTILLSVLMLGCGGGGGWEDIADGNAPGDSSTAQAPETKSNTPPYLGAGMFAVDAQNFQTEVALDILRASSSPVLSYIPGVFGSDKENYPYMMDTLLAEGIDIHVQLYVLCGPCRPPRRNGDLVQFRRDLDIGRFNDAIRWDPEVRSQYQDYVINVIKPLIDRYPQVSFTVVPELEDNQVDDSFAALLDLTALVLGGRSNVKFQRNPLSYNGVRTYNGRTVSIEMHTAHIGNLVLLQAGDTISLDGQTFSFKGEQIACSVDATYQEIEAMIKEAMNRGINYHLWRSEWQGLPICGGDAPSPANRNYQFTHVDQIKELMSLR